MNTKLRILIVIGLLGLGSLAWTSQVFACPGCKEAMASFDDEDGTPQDGYGNLGQAMSYSVLFMLGMLFTVLTGFSGAFYVSYRRALKAKEAAASAKRAAASPIDDEIRREEERLARGGV